MPTMRPSGERPRIFNGTPGYRQNGDARELQRAARQELDRAQRLRADAERYYQETTVRARSEAQQLMLKARMAIDREVAALTKKANEDIQKVLADIRVIRITAQEELAAQRKANAAARLCSKSLDLDHEVRPISAKSKKVLATASSRS